MQYLNTQKLLYIVFPYLFSALILCVISFLGKFNSILSILLFFMCIGNTFKVIFTINIKSINYINMFVPMYIITIAIFGIVQFHEVYLGGRDDGVYANSAIEISKHGSYCFSNINILSYPGYILSNDCIQQGFYPAYTIWLAWFISIFGYYVVPISQALLLIFGLLSFYGLSIRLFGLRTSIIAILIFTTTYCFTWVSRKTYSENLALCLVFYSLLCLVEYYKTSKVHIKWFGVISVLLLSLTRIEGIIFASLYTIFIFLRSNNFRKIIYDFIIVFVLFIPFYYYVFILNTSTISQLSSFISNIYTNIVHSGVLSTTNYSQLRRAQIDPNALEYHIPQMSLYILNLYNALLYILLACIGLASIIKRDKYQFKLIIMIIFIILPHFVYIFNPSISFDMPWFLRRYYHIIFPWLSLLSAVALGYMRGSLKYIILLLIITINIALSYPSLLVKEYSGSIEQTKLLSKQLSYDKSVYYIDYNSIGDAKIGEPLYFLYNFQTIALDQKSLENLLNISLSQGGSLYNSKNLSTPKSNICHYEDYYIITNRKSEISKNILKFNPEYVNYTALLYPRLAKTCEIFRLTQTQGFSEMGHVLTQTAMDYCNNVPRESQNMAVDLAIYKLSSAQVDDIHSSYCKK